MYLQVVDANFTGQARTFYREDITTWQMFAKGFSLGLKAARRGEKFGEIEKKEKTDEHRKTAE